MRILHVNEHLAPVGGVETYMLGLVPRLEALGHEIRVGFGSGDPGLVRNPEPLKYLPSTRHRDVQAGRAEMSRLIGRLKPDVVHLHGIQNLGVIQAAAEAGAVVMHGHDFRPICPVANFFYKRSRRICQRVAGPGCFGVTMMEHCMTPRPLAASYAYRRVRWIAQHASMIGSVIAPSREAKRRFVAAGFDPGNVRVLPYFCPVPIRRSPRTLPSTPTVTFLGRASYNKGWDVFLEALGMLPPNVHGLMIGSFSDRARQQIAHMSQSMGCHSRLTVEGWAGRNAIGSVFERTTVLAFPSLWPETLGIVGLEAMAHGVPVVASSVGGVEEWLDDRQTGLLVPPNDSKSLADSLLHLVENSVLSESMGRCGLRKVASEFGAETHVDQLVELYTAVRSIA